LKYTTKPDLNHAGKFQFNGKFGKQKLHFNKMENLSELRKIKQEAVHMEFNYRNVQRIMYLVYQTKVLLEEKYPIPNKDIALDQTKKVISNEIMKLIKADDEETIKAAFTETIDSFKLVLNYIS
jgi:hypothetical protein